MGSTIRVDLHCHSTMSDGGLTPEAVADFMARARVACASLTDHDTLDGLTRFSSVLGERGINYLSGVEISATSEEGMIHLLAYGFDPENQMLRKMLLNIRSQYHVSPTLMWEELKDLYAAVRRRPGNGCVPPKKTGVREVAEVVHQAGGLLFLAHPLAVREKVEALDEMLAKLKTEGLDGLEAIYGPYEKGVRQDLEGLAENHQLLVSFGTDFHGDLVYPALNRAGIEVEERHWETFLGAVGGSR